MVGAPFTYRQVTNCSFKIGKDMIDNLPCCVLEGVSLESATNAAELLKNCGGVVIVEPNAGMALLLSGFSLCMTASLI